MKEKGGKREKSNLKNSKAKDELSELRNNKEVTFKLVAALKLHSIVLDERCRWKVLFL